MKRMCVLLVATVAAATWATLARAEEPVGEISPFLVQRLETEIERGIVPWDPAELHRECIRLDGDVERALAHLEAIADDEAEPNERRYAALWVAVGLHACRGDARAAWARAHRVVLRTDSTAARLVEARLLDRIGRVADARKSYEAVLERDLDATTEAHVRLRVALLAEGSDEEAAKPLVEFAIGADDDETSNRSAIVLALRGRPKEALSLYVPSGEGKTRFRQEVRLAEWALAADDAEQAQTHAWRALRTAGVRRDRRYALTLLVQGYRKAEALDALIEKFGATADLAADSREVWIDLLRETGKTEEALSLFRESANGRFTATMRRELLEICREAGREDLLVRTYGEMIRDEPEVIEWREGLSRHHLERGNRDAAAAVWAGYLDDPARARYRLAAAEALRELGLDELAIAAAERTITDGGDAASACLFLFDLHRSRGRPREAEEALTRLDRIAPPAAHARKALGEAYERLGRKNDAVRVLEALREALGNEGAAEDLDMRLAWLQSEVGEEEVALERWQELWRRIDSVARRRYVEDRMMTVASRLGKLADIAIDLEERLIEGRANARESGLLVRIYTKVNDSVSATEVIDEHFRQTGGDPVKALSEKARTFLACTDYHRYEETIRELMEADPKGRGDYLRQLAMSQLERGKPDEAREVIAELSRLDDGADSAEFEAGVLSLAGLREEAIAVYRKGIAHRPDRIESYLLMGDLMRQVGRVERGVGLFQHLAETAEKDDLFTVAIDGLLNLAAPPAVLRWARRITMERLARRHDKMYLYQLIADLSEELNDPSTQRRALESALPSAGEQRLTLLRELMDQTRSRPADSDHHLAFGRRLLGLGEIAPPQVYLDLGQTFLRHGEVTNAAKTFGLATEVPDRAAFQRQVATAFETAGYPGEALRTYERLLVSRSGDVALMAKVGEMQEQIGRDERSRELYERAIDLMLARRPFSTAAKKKEEPANPYAYYWARNVGDFELHYASILVGLLTTLPEGEVEPLLRRQRALVDKDVLAVEQDEREEKRLRGYPRLQDRAAYVRRLAFAFGRVAEADDMDRLLLKSLSGDDELLESLVRARLEYGLVASARGLIAGSGRNDEERSRVGILVGERGTSSAVGFLPPGEVVRLLLPLVASGEREELRDLLRRVDLAPIAKGKGEEVPLLLAAAFDLGDGPIALRIARASLVGTIKHDKNPMSSYTIGHTVRRLQGHLDRDEYRSLCDHVVSLVLETPGKGGRWLGLIPQLQATVEEPLLDAERVDKLLETIDEAGYGWLGQLLGVLPEKERGRALRAMLPKVAKTRRMWFVLQLLSNLEKDADEDFADLLVEAFRQGLEDVDRNQRYAFNGFGQLLSRGTNVDLKLRLAKEAREKHGENLLVRAAYAVLLDRAGREDEALVEALGAWDELVRSTSKDYTLNSARTQLTQVFLDKHRDRFLASIDQQEKEGADPLRMTQRRLDLVTQSGDRDALLAFLRKAVEEHPDDAGFLNRLQPELSRRGLVEESMSVLERVVEKSPENTYLRRRLVIAWQRLRNPAKALAAARPEQGKPEKDDPARQATRVSIRDVKAAVDAGDEDKARTSWRRLWRMFRIGLGNARHYAFYPSGRRMTWPADAPAESRSAVRSRGGLGGILEDPVEAPPARDAYDAITETSFGEDEIRRQVRTWAGRQLSSSPTVLDALARAEAARIGRDELLSRILDVVEEGRAGTRDYATLLALVEAGETGDRAAAALGDLVRTLQPGRTGQTRRLARLLALKGDAPRAARLYRWCGTHASPVRVYTGPGAAVEQVDANTLVREIETTLEGDLRNETIEAVLRLAAPDVDSPIGRNYRDGYDSLVLSTWTRILGPDAALARNRKLCEELAVTGKDLRRNAAKAAVSLWARDGDGDRALACLEHAIAKVEPPEDSPPHMVWQYRRTFFSNADVRRFFPSDTTGWADPVGWFRAAAERIRFWLETDRVETARARPALAVLAVRLHRRGETGPAREILLDLERRSADEPSALLWVIDVARILGDEERARAIEMELLRSGRLHVERVPEVLARHAEADRADALALGEKALAWTHHPDLLALLERTARALGDEVRAKRFAEIAEADRKAEAELEKVGP